MEIFEFRDVKVMGTEENWKLAQFQVLAPKIIYFKNKIPKFIKPVIIVTN